MFPSVSRSNQSNDVQAAALFWLFNMTALMKGLRMFHFICEIMEICCSEISVERIRLLSEKQLFVVTVCGPPCNVRCNNVNVL